MIANLDKYIEHLREAKPLDKQIVVDIYKEVGEIPNLGDKNHEKISEFANQFSWFIHKSSKFILASMNFASKKEIGESSVSRSLLVGDDDYLRHLACLHSVLLENGWIHHVQEDLVLLFYLISAKIDSFEPHVAEDSVFRTRAQGSYYGSIVLSGCRGLVVAMGPEIWKQLINNPACITFCKPFCEEMKGLIPKKGEEKVSLSLTLNSLSGGAVGDETKNTVAMLLRSVTTSGFNESTDSSHSYHTNEENILQSNREKNRDGLFALWKGFQKEGVARFGDRVRTFLNGVDSRNLAWLAKHIVEQVLARTSDLLDGNVHIRTHGKSSKSKNDLINRVMQQRVTDSGSFSNSNRQFFPRTRSGSNKGGQKQPLTTSSQKVSQISLSQLPPPLITMTGLGDPHEFFFHFCEAADSYKLNTHFITVLLSGLSRLMSNGVRDVMTQELNGGRLSNLLRKSCVYGRCLGFLLFSPSWYTFEGQSRGVLAALSDFVEMKNGNLPCLDVRMWLHSAIEMDCLVLVVPWACEFLKMMVNDRVNRHTTYYSDVFSLLHSVRQTSFNKIIGGNGSGTFLFLSLLIDDLFSLLSVSVSSMNSTIPGHAKALFPPSAKGLDILTGSIVVSHVFYRQCFPHIERLRTILEKDVKRTHEKIPEEKAKTVSSASRIITPVQTQDFNLLLAGSLFAQNPDLKWVGDIALEKIIPKSVSVAVSSVIPKMVVDKMRVMFRELEQEGGDDVTQQWIKKPVSETSKEIVGPIMGLAMDELIRHTRAAASRDIRQVMELLAPIDTPAPVLSQAQEMVSQAAAGCVVDYVRQSAPSLVLHVTESKVREVRSAAKLELRRGNKEDSALSSALEIIAKNIVSKSNSDMGEKQPHDILVINTIQSHSTHPMSEGKQSNPKSKSLEISVEARPLPVAVQLFPLPCDQVLTVTDSLVEKSRLNDIGCIGTMPKTDGAELGKLIDQYSPDPITKVKQISFLLEGIGTELACRYERVRAVAAERKETVISQTPPRLLWRISKVLMKSTLYLCSVFSLAVKNSTAIHDLVRSWRYLCLQDASVIDSLPSIFFARSSFEELKDAHCCGSENSSDTESDNSVPMKKVNLVKDSVMPVDTGNVSYRAIPPIVSISNMTKPIKDHSMVDSLAVIFCAVIRSCDQVTVKMLKSCTRLLAAEDDLILSCHVCLALTIVFRSLVHPEEFVDTFIPYSDSTNIGITAGKPISSQDLSVLIWLIEPLLRTIRDLRQSPISSSNGAVVSGMASLVRESVSSIPVYLTPVLQRNLDEL